MKIEIDTNNLSDMDIAMLQFLAMQNDGGEPAPEPVVTPPVKAAAPKKAAEPKKVEPEPEDLLGEAPTMADAVAAATVLVSSGGAAKVKEALAEAGAKRVSELAVDQIPAFLAALA